MTERVIQKADPGGTPARSNGRRYGGVALASGKDTDRRRRKTA